MFEDMFGGMFKPVIRDSCKLSIDGQIAVRTSGGYKTYNIKTGKLTNCDNFAFSMDNMFWVLPTFHVNVGDIILVNGRPHAVREVNDNSIKAFCYEDSTIVEVVPEHHVFMGKTYCYGKIFSPFLGMANTDSGMQNMMTMMMMSQMMGSKNSSHNDMMSFNPMMMMFMGGMKDNPFMNMFEGAFDFGEEKSEDKEEA